MAENFQKEWILPADIPFADLKAKDLEECVYWLLDAMGAKDLEWRIGGSGGGAADGGRDLEAHFFEADDDGDLMQQRWWIECKGRRGTVDPDEVKSAVNNALAYEGVDRLIIATNTQYSNPTRDWIKAWQSKYPVPKVQLWDRTHLERYLSRHPDVVLRLFSEALSLNGRCKAMEDRFWNKLEFVSGQTLADLWKARESLELTGTALFAAIANEFAGGDITHRSWGCCIQPDSRVDILGSGFANVPYLMVRSSKAGIDQRILHRTYAYLVILALEHSPASVVASQIIHSMNRSEVDVLPEKIQDILIEPILNQIFTEIQDLCADDCCRMMLTSRRAFPDREDEIKRYWLRFDPPTEEVVQDDRYVIIEKTDAPCAVGFAVNKSVSCPLFACDPSVKELAQSLDVVKRVTAFRKAQAAEKRATDERRMRELEHSRS